jgi:predicted GNAT family acetyltransferase
VGNDVDVTVANAEDRQRYEARVGDDVAGYAEYRWRDGLLVLTHTVVDDAFEGQGVGSTLVRHVLDDARRQDVKIVPRCAFVRSFLERHPEYDDLVAERPAQAG